MAQRDLHRDRRAIRMRDQVNARLGVHARDHGLRVDEQCAAGRLGPVGAAAMTVQVQAQQVQNLVTLYKVLGGGWKEGSTN